MTDTSGSTTLVQSRRPPRPVSQHPTCGGGAEEAACSRRSRWPNSTRASSVRNSKVVRKRCGALATPPPIPLPEAERGGKKNSPPPRLGEGDGGRGCCSGGRP